MHLPAQILLVLAHLVRLLRQPHQTEIKSRRRILLPLSLPYQVSALLHLVPPLHLKIVPQSHQRKWYCALKRPVTVTR